MPSSYRNKTFSQLIFCSCKRLPQIISDVTFVSFCVIFCTWILIVIDSRELRLEYCDRCFSSIIFFYILFVRFNCALFPRTTISQWVVNHIVLSQSFFIGPSGSADKRRTAPGEEDNLFNRKLPDTTRRQSS